MRSLPFLKKALPSSLLALTLAATLGGLPAAAAPAAVTPANNSVAPAAVPAATPSGDLTVEVEGRVIFYAHDEVEGGDGGVIYKIKTEQGVQVEVTDPAIIEQIQGAQTVTAEVSVPAATVTELDPPEQTVLAQDSSDGAVDGSTAPAQALLTVAAANGTATVTAVDVVVAAPAAPPTVPSGTITHKFWVLIVDPTTGYTGAAGKAATTAERTTLQKLLDNTKAFYEQNTTWKWSFT
ncbi:MAG: hypothetical protein LBR19_03395, partial [Bifidobacteriaceae bacterium]|nr:hypothetical protein [Bifidobacteriaceae bacterium]